MNKWTLLKELKENLINEDLNFEDRSVGIYATSDLVSWAKYELPELEGIELVSVTEKQAVIRCEGKLFEIYLETFMCGEEEMDSKWAIRIYEEETQSI